MITLPVTPSTDNKAVFVFKFLTKWGAYYVSNALTGISGVDYSTLRFGSDSTLQTKIQSAISGGAVDYSSNFELNIIRGSNELTTTFFNDFYPNTNKVLLGSIVQAYITWESETDIANLIPLFSGKIVNYSYSDSIYISIERSLVFINNELPVYNTQKDNDNVISYTPDIEDDNLGTVIPLLYGIYTPYLLIDISGTTDDIYIPKTAGIQSVIMDKDQLTHKVASHIVAANNNASYNRLMIFEEALRQYIFADSLNPTTDTLTTTHSESIGGSDFSFVKFGQSTLVVGNTFFIPTLEGYNNASTFWSIDSITGFSVPLIVGTSSPLAITFLNNNNTFKNYAFYNATSIATGDIFAHAVLTNTSGGSVTLSLKAYDNRTHYDYTGSVVPIFTIPDGTTTGLLSTSIGVAISPSLSKYKFNADSAEVDAGDKISLNDIVYKFTVSPSSITMYNFVIQIKNIILGGDYYQGKNAVVNIQYTKPTSSISFQIPSLGR